MSCAVREAYSGVLVSVGEAAALLSVSERAIRKAVSERRFSGFKVVENGKRQHRIHLTSLPEPAQVKYWLKRMGETFRPDTPPDALRQWALSLQLEPGVHRLLLNRAGLNVSEPDPLAWSPEESTSRHDAFIRLPTAAQEKARRRAQLLRGFALAKRKAPQGCEGEAEEAFAKAKGVGVSTLRRWFKEVRHLDQQDWEPALVPGWHGGKKRMEVDPVLLAHLKGEYLVKSRPTLRSAWRKTERFAKAKGLAMPSYEVMKARIKELDRTFVILMREGEEAFDQCFPGVIRDWSTMALHEQWCTDGRMPDVGVEFPDGEVRRPVYVGVMDMRSRYWLSCEIGKGENTDTVRKSIVSAVVEAGNCVPQSIYMDNGAAFNSKAISGGQAKRNRFKAKAEEVVGMLVLMGVEVALSNPGRAQSKPIESLWNTPAREVDQCAENAKAYCGRNTVERPEGNDPLKHPIKFERLREQMEEEREAYNNRPHRSLGGKTPHEVYMALKDQSAARTLTKDQLSWIGLVPQLVKLSKRDRSFTINGNVYWHPELAKLTSQGPYTARYDATDSAIPVQVFDGQTWICAAELRLRTGARNMEAAKDVIRAKQQAKRAIKDIKDAHKKEQRALRWDVEKPPAAPGAVPLPAPKVASLVRPPKNYKPGKVANGDREPGVNPYITPEMEANRARKIAAMGGRF